MPVSNNVLTAIEEFDNIGLYIIVKEEGEGKYLYGSPASAKWTDDPKNAQVFVCRNAATYAMNLRKLWYKEKSGQEPTLYCLEAHTSFL